MYAFVLGLSLENASFENKIEYFADAVHYPLNVSELAKIVLIKRTLKN